jgi:hypothetical protein
MTSEIKNTTGVLARMAAWWHGLFETVPPDLAQCEFECRERTCDAEKFDGCLNRLAYESRIRETEVKAAAPSVAASTTNNGAQHNKHNGRTCVGFAD